MTTQTFMRKAFYSLNMLRYIIIFSCIFSGIGYEATTAFIYAVSFAIVFSCFWVALKELIFPYKERIVTSFMYFYNTVLAQMSGTKPSTNHNDRNPTIR